MNTFIIIKVMFIVFLYLIQMKIVDLKYSLGGLLPLARDEKR